MPYARLGTTTDAANIEKVWKLREIAIALPLSVGQCNMLLRTSSAIMPGKGGIYWNLEWDIHQAWYSNNSCFELWMRGNYSVSTRILLSCCRLEMLKHTIPGIQHAPLKGGRREGSCFCTQSISSCLTMLPPLENMYDMHNQVTFPKMPTCLSSRPGGYVLSPTVTII